MTWILDCFVWFGETSWMQFLLGCWLLFSNVQNNWWPVSAHWLWPAINCKSQNFARSFLCHFAAPLRHCARFQSIHHNQNSSRYLRFRCFLRALFRLCSNLWFVLVWVWPSPSPNGCRADHLLIAFLLADAPRPSSTRNSVCSLFFFVSSWRVCSVIFVRSDGAPPPGPRPPASPPPAGLLHCCCCCLFYWLRCFIPCFFALFTC